MALTDVLGLTVELEADTSFMKELTARAKKISIDFDSTALVQKFGKMQKPVQKLFSETIADAATAGFTRMNIKGFQDKLRPLTNEIEASLERMFDTEVKIQLAAQEKRDASVEKHTLEMERLKLAELHRRFNLERKATDRLLERRKKALEEAHRLATRNLGEVGEDWGKSIESGFAKIKSGDLAGLLKGIGGGVTPKMTKWGSNLSKKAEDMGGGKQAKLLGMLGGFITKVGPAIAAIGALAAGLAAVVAVIVAADAAMKDLNRTLADSGVGAADLANQYKRLGSTLDDISRHFAEGFTVNRIWGVTAKEHMEILGAFHQAGVSLQQMAAGADESGDRMERLEKHTVAALTYAKLLGMTNSEVGAMMGSYMEELGMTVQGVQERFSGIAAAAKESGFSTKRFFNMLLQATSGMSMYNVRLEEAAGLLVNLSQVLGQQKGGEFLQGLVKGFKDESTQDRIRKSLILGVSDWAKILQIDAKAKAESFARQLGDLSKEDAAKGSQVQGLLKAQGLDPSKATEFMQRLRKLSPTELGQLAAGIQDVGGTAAVGLGRQVLDLATSAQAFRGDLAGVTAARALAGPNAALLAAMNMPKAMTGKTVGQISETELKNLMATEGITGESAEELRKTRNIEIIMRGRYANALKAGKTAKGESFEEWLMRQQAAPGTEATVAQDILLAQEIAKKTTDMAKILEHGVQWLLSQIYNKVSIIASKFGADRLEKNEETAIDQAAKELADALNKTKDARLEQQRALVTAQESLKTESSPEKRAQLQKEVEDRTKAIKALDTRAALQEGALRSARDLMGDPETLRAYKGGQKLGAGDVALARAAMLGSEQARAAMEAVDPEGYKALVERGKQEVRRKSSTIAASRSRSGVPSGGTEIHLSDAERSAIIGREFAAQAVEAEVNASTAAQDWIGGVSGGRAWGQRISSADDVTATAHKAGGPVRSTSGGRPLVINSFGNSAEVIRGIQAAVAAGVL